MFSNIVGNDEIKEYLKKISSLKNYSNSYIFSGKEGIGKKIIARDWAKEIICENEEQKLKFENNAHPDFKEYAPIETRIKIDQIRELQEKIIEKPILSNKKIYIIDNAETMTEEAQNCLLKTLEEPPQYAIIILIVSNDNRLLPTIKSRCISVKFRELSKEEVKRIANDIPEKFLDILDGSFGKYELIKDNQEKFEKLYEFVNNIQSYNLQQLLNNDVLYDNKDIIMDLLDYMNILFYKKKMFELINIIEKTKQKLLLNNNYEMSIDYLMINIWKCIK